MKIFNVIEIDKNFIENSFTFNDIENDINRFNEAPFSSFQLFHNILKKTQN